METIKRTKIAKRILISIMTLILIVSCILAMKQIKEDDSIIASQELLRAMSYEQFEDGDENVVGTDNVKFSAFFLRDLDGDGYAEKLKGTCKEIGTEDTLYMEINVQTSGYLKDGKIEINGENFYLSTTLPKDQELKENYIGTNTKTIELNDFSAGKQKVLTGKIHSDYNNSLSAINNNINNYSSNNNKIVLTGVYVDEDGNEKDIKKEVKIAIDWYGKVSTKFDNTKQYYDNLPQTINQEDETLNLNFEVKTFETKNELLLKKNYVEGIIPELNGYKPLSVTTTANDVEFTYDEETGKFVVIKEAEIDENNKLIKNAYTNTVLSNRYTLYVIKVVYPLEAYRITGEERVDIQIPVISYYEGYNNPNSEFTNPYKSDEVSETIKVSYVNPRESVRAAYIKVTVGKYIYFPNARYVISKEKPIRIYNGLSENEDNDLYVVRWFGYTGTHGTMAGLIMKETPNGESQVVDEFVKTDNTKESMEDITTNVGIGFSYADELLGNEGWIKVYDVETDNLLVTFTKNGDNGTEKWSRYNEENPYKYNFSVKHIRIETSTANKDASIYIYNIKKLDDQFITENYTREEFDKFKNIESKAVGYIGNQYVDNDEAKAIYEAPYSLATIELSNKTISTQKKEENEKIIIRASMDNSINRLGWKNGSFLVKLPDEIVDIEINDVSINNNKIEVLSTEVIQNENGRFIKILTHNNEDVAQAYSITINCNLTPNPKTATKTKSIELYASNEELGEYYNASKDVYDVNDNLNTEEFVNKTITNIQLVAPNTLLTNQTAEIKNGENDSEIVISPQLLELRPLYTEEDKQEVKIGVQITNNYSSAISDVQILGKIPFEGNTYVISQSDLGSEFTTTMKSTGIEIPEELNNNISIYYSENENPSRDIENKANGWKRFEDVTDWTKIKSYTIDFEDIILSQEAEYVFYYIVEIPNGVELNKTAYSHHGVYFSLNTEAGKYRTQTEPQRVGVCLSEKYNLKLTKYQKDKDKKISGAIYKVSKLDDNDNIIETSTATTKTDGTFEMTNLYAENIYKIEEIKSPEEYELNSEAIKFIGHVDRNGNITIEKLSGTTKEDISVTKQIGESYKANISVEDEVKLRLKINKVDKETNEPIKLARYKVTGEGLPVSGRIISTNIDGEVILKGLKIGEEYTLQEVKADGYYINSEEIKFKVQNNNGTYEATVSEVASVKSSSITENDSIPTINITLTDEKIPTYNLKITKIKQLTQVEEGQEGNQNQEIEYLSGAKFKLYKEGKEIGTYVTDTNGNIVIENLYQYDANKDIEQTYTLKEVMSPEGYSKVKDIVFYAEKITETEIQRVVDDVTGEEREVELTTTRIELKQELGDGEKAREWSIEGNTINIVVEDIPSFKLIKKDSETGEVLSGVKFAIYNIDDEQEPAKNSKGEFVGTKELIDGKEYYVVTTNNSGELTLDLQEGLYKAIEVEANEKYDLSNSTYYFGIGASRKGKLKAHKGWSTEFGEKRQEDITSISETIDGGYIIGGLYRSESLTVGNYTLTNAGGVYQYDLYYSDGYLVKYNSAEEVEWAISIGNNNVNDQVNSVSVTSDGGFLVGVSGGTFGNNTRSKIIKFNSSGEIEWTDLIGQSDDKIVSVSETLDGGYIVVGTFRSDSITLGEYTLVKQGYQNGMIVKYGSNRDVEWVASIGGTGTENLNSIVVNSDGGYIVGGSFTSDTIIVGEYTLINQGSTDGMVIKYSSSGDVEWANSVGGTSNDEIKSVAETTDKNIIVGGTFNSESITVGEDIFISQGHSTYYSDGIIIRYSEDGKVTWATSMAGSDHVKINSVIGTTDGGFIVGGYFGSESLTVGDYILKNNYVNSTHNYKCNTGMVVKYSGLSEVEWAETFGEPYQDTNIKSIIENSRGEYVVGEEFLIGNNGGYIYTGNYDIRISKIVSVKAIPDIVAKENIKVADGGIIITSVRQMSNGGYIAGGYFDSNSVTIGDFVLTKKGGSYASGNTSYSDGIILKYNKDGTVNWATSIGNYGISVQITSVIDTADGGFMATGTFDGYGSYTIGDYIFRSKGRNDGFVIKFSSVGEVEWAESIGGNGDDYIKSIIETRDGGFLICGYYSSENITLGEYILENKGGYDGFIIKYNSKREVEWANLIGEVASSEYIYSISETKDGDYITVGYKGSSSAVVTVGKYTLTKAGGFIIRYSCSGNVEWADSIAADGIIKTTSISSTRDGGYIIGGSINSQTVKVGDYTLIRNNKESFFDDGIIIKYNSDKEIEWINQTNDFSDNNADRITSISEIGDGEYLVGGNYKKGTWWSSSIILSDYIGNIQVLYEKPGVEEIQELEVENKRKEYKITTDIEEIDNVKGGSISGEDEKEYEIIKYGDSSNKEIKIIPDSNYEIIKITINELEWNFEPESDGSYTIPQFDNVQEDKNIIVTFALKNNKIIINKKDSITNDPIEGAKFKLDQIDERTEPINEDIIGALTDNGQTYTSINYDKKITDVIGDIENSDDELYFVTLENEDGSKYYVPTNGKTYIMENGKDPYPYMVSAQSNIPIDLSKLNGTYKIIVNISNVGGGVPRVHVLDSAYTQLESLIPSNVYYDFTNKEYESVSLLQGGEKYYLSLVFKNATGGGYSDMIVNSIKIYETDEYQYVFTKNQDGEYESTNTGRNNTVCNSYIPINLENCLGKYNITVNAQISTASGDYGYVTLNTTNSPAPAYDSNSTIDKRIVYITGNQKAQNYTIEVEGGYQYYLHLGYYKDGIINTYGEDYFRVNNINVSLSDSELYHTNVTTNSLGQAITQIPFGKYQITEIKTAEDYVPKKIPVIKDNRGNVISDEGIIEFRSTEGNVHNFTIENEKYGHVIVHHILKESGEKVAADDELIGLQGEKYTALPNVSISKYEIEKDEDGNEVLPDNMNGIYKYENQEVTYYYVAKKIPLIVHHYIEGTIVNVPLANGTESKDITSYRKKGEEYETSPIKASDLDEKYELLEMPENANGILGEDIVEVTYYYKRTKRPLTIHKVDKDTDEQMEGVEFEIYEGNYGLIDLPEPENIGNVYEKLIADKSVESEIELVVDMQEGWDEIGTGKYAVQNSYWNNVDINNNYGSNFTPSLVLTVDLKNYSEDDCFIIEENVEMTNTSSTDYLLGIYSPNPTGDEYLYQLSGENNKTYEMVLQGGEKYQIGTIYRKIGSFNPEEILTDYVTAEFKLFECENVRKETVNEVPKFNEVTVISIGESVDVVGEMQENEMYQNYGYSSFYKEDNKYIPMSSQKYINDYSVENPSNTSVGYCEIDLEGKDGYYQLNFNVEKDGTERDILEGILSEDANLMGHYDLLFMIYGIQDSKDYTKILQGGKKYYLYFAYMKESDSSVIDSASINNVQVNLVDTTINEIEMGFDKDNNGRYISNIQGQSNAEAHSVIPIDLRNYYGYIDITVNAEISCDEYSDKGEVIVTDVYNLENTFNYWNELVMVTGQVEAQDYTLELKGGKVYYLHMIYDKGYSYYGSVGDDTFTINSINVEPKCYATITTDENGIAEITLPTNDYTLVELNSKEDYEPIEPQQITVSRSGLEITIENQKKKGRVTINHFVEGTSENITDYEGKEVKPEQKEGRYGDTFESHSRIDLNNKYEVVEIPDKTSGEYGEEEQIITYYYRLKKYPYVVNYLFKDDDDDDSNNAIIHAQKADGFDYEYGTIIDAEDEQVYIEGFLYNSANPEHLTITEKNNIINLYYILDDGMTKELSYTVEYYKDNIKVDDDTITRKSNVQVLEPDTLPIDKSLISDNNMYDGFKLDHTTPAEVPSIINDGDIIKVYYVKRDDLSYIVHYKEEGTNETIHEDKVVNNQLYGNQVEETAIDIPGYEKVNPTTADIQITTGANECTFYYKKAKYNYSVEYYYNSIIDDSKTDIIEATYLDKITTYTDKNIPGYELFRVDGLPLTISYDENNIIKVYYVTDPTQTKTLSYTINYYKDGEIVDDDTITKTVVAHVTEPDKVVIDKTLIEDEDKYYGYKLDSTIPTIVPYEINDGEVINVYYVKDNTQTKELSYTIEYYKDNEKVEGDTITKSENVQVLEPDTLSLDRSLINDNDKYYGYKQDITDPTDVPDIVNNGDIIKVYYIKDEVPTKELRYTIEYYKDNVLQENDTETINKVVPISENDTLDVNKSLINTTNRYDDYTFEKTNPEIIPNTIENGGVIKVYYVRTKYPYRVEYYYNEIIDNTMTENGENYKDEIIDKYDDKVKDGYVFENVVGLPMIISADGENIIKVYYSPIRKIVIYHIDKNTGDIIKVEKKSDKEGNTTTTKPLDLEGYTIVERPESEEFTFKEDEQVAKYYYAKNTQVLVKYVDEESGEELTTSEIIKGYVGKSYTTEQKDIEGYIFKEVNGNVNGKMSQDEEEIIYYYVKEKDDELIIPEIEKPDTDSEKTDKHEEIVIINLDELPSDDNVKEIPANKDIPKPPKNTILPVANTGSNRSTTYRVIGSMIVVLGIIIAFVYWKITYKKFYR